MKNKQFADFLKDDNLEDDIQAILLNPMIIF